MTRPTLQRTARVTPVPSRAQRVRLTLLDSFELMADGRSLPVPFTAQRLLALLALSDRSLPRHRVAGTLWPDASASRAGPNLRSALWRLPAIGLVDATASCVRIRPDVAIDYREAMAIARAVIDRSTSVEGPVEALTRDLLPDWDEEWLWMERERYRHLRLHALERLCERLTDCGRFEGAVEVGQLAVAGDVLRETAHRALIRAYVAEGNRGAALRQYRAYVRLLREELDTEPSPAIADLVHLV